MSQNKIPKDASLLIQLGTDMLPGLVSLGETLGITQVPPVTFEFALQDFIACEEAFSAFRSAKRVALTTLVEAEGALREWLGVTRNVLAGRYGNRWSALWAEAGFTDNSTAVPAKAGKRLTLALALTTFFTAHPTYQVTDLLVTAARATTLRNAVLAAQQALAAIEVNMDGQWETRSTSRETLVGLMRTVIAVLKRTIGPLDPRWTAFGLNKPGADTTPGQPLNLSVGLDTATGKMVAQCDEVALAQRYRWRMRIAGSGLKYELVGRSTGPSVLIAPPVPGTVVEVIVQAVNGGVQGVASESVLFTMPLATAAAAPLPVEEKAAPARYGYAEGNGNGNGAHARFV